jgi:ArsR family transcriptional regulator
MKRYNYFYVHETIEIKPYRRGIPAMAEKAGEHAPIDREDIVTAFKALSNVNRLAIFEQIRKGQACGEMNADNRLTVCCVAENFNISLSTISHHIKELKAAKLVNCEKKGQFML